MSVLDENLIILDLDVNTAEECIQEAGEVLLKNGYVNEGYVEAVIAREKQYPTGLQGNKIAIAIPHTEVEFVNKPAVGVIVPKQPIKFCAMGTKDEYLDCELIFPLVVKNPHMQVEMLKRMMKVMQDSDLLEKVKNSKSKEEVIQLLSILEY